MSYTSLSSSGEGSAAVIYRTSTEFCTDDPRRAGTPPQSQFLTRFGTATLHIGLVGVHLAILVIAFERLEHNITFSVGLQTTVSFWTTAISTTIGTVYCSCLVFLSQKLALQPGTPSQSLTVVHDNISSWRGFGSALSVLYNQVALPASVLQSLVVVLYLGGISILHITIPATFSVETFNATIFLEVPTVGLPEYNASLNINASYGFTIEFPSQFLPWFGNLQESQTIGLFNGTLYEVLQGSNLGPGIANVSAAGINISCGYAPPEGINVTSRAPFQFTLGEGFMGLDEDLGTQTTRANTVQVVPATNSVILWTTIEVQDSSGNTGNPVMVDGAKDLNNATINQIQLLQCSKSIVAPSAFVDTETTQVDKSSIYPDIYKTESTWESCLNLNLTAEDSTLLGSDAWSGILATEWGFLISSPMLRSEKLYLPHEQVNQSAQKSHGIPRTINSLQLHDIENGLSSIVAITFWIAGHIPPDRMAMQLAERYNSPVLVPPVLATGTTTAQRVSTRVRLNAWCGFGTSVILLMLFASSIASSTGPNGCFPGPGILRAIWWFQKNAEDIDFLQNVCQPTELNLRIAGLNVMTKKSPPTFNPKHLKSFKAERGLSARTILTVNWPKIIGIILHILLVLVHSILLWIRATNRDHQIVFQLGHQGVISLGYKVMSAVIGTVSSVAKFLPSHSSFKSYYSILLYLVQTQAISHVMNTHHTLTSIHDRVNSWAGLGSSIATLYQQFALPASFSAVSTLHVTTPALISVETFNSTVSSQVAIEGLPQWPDSDNETLCRATLWYLQNDAQFLEYISTLDLPQTVGLFNGTLYDTLTGVYTNGGLIDVSATGFEVTCGYLPGVAMSDAAAKLVNVSFGQLGWTQVVVPGPDVVTLRAMYPDSGLQDPGLSDSIIVYTTNKVLDSAGNSGIPVDVSQVAQWSSVHQLQFLRCRRYLVPQSAQVDPGSRTIMPDKLKPVIYKTQSNWLSFSDLPVAMDNGSSLINSSSGPGLGLDTGPLYPTWGDVFIMEQLGLQPETKNGVDDSTNRTLYLHEFENAVSNLIASVFCWRLIWLEGRRIEPREGMNRYRTTRASSLVVITTSNIFWIVGHIRPPPLTMKYGFSNGSLGAITANVQKPPILEQKTTTLTQTVPAARLNVSPLAASIGLAGSVMLLILAVIVCGTSIGTPPSCLQSMGLLQSFWVYRHHPELWEINDHLEEPTDRDLRATGLVKIRLLDARNYNPSRTERKAKKHDRKKGPGWWARASRTARCGSHACVNAKTEQNEGSYPFKVYSIQYNILDSEGAHQFVYSELPSNAAFHIG
ncbi:hypothetical protein C8R45DRAFT_1083520 [Mycena sanguinolenta]|nr:hypothetical protein C8R45DRAFT_1083520 [Mycena sanguinolenta]